MKSFRAIEQTGKFIGFRDPFEKEFRYPFHVFAVKQVQVAALSAKDLLEVFSMDNRADIEHICEVLEKEYKDIQVALTKQREDGGPRQSAAERSKSISEHRRSSLDISSTAANLEKRQRVIRN